MADTHASRVNQHCISHEFANSPPPLFRLCRALISTNQEMGKKEKESKPRITFPNRTNHFIFLFPDHFFLEFISNETRAFLSLARLC